jgi:predicted nucleic acid-binding Zn ribbon protein
MLHQKELDDMATILTPKTVTCRCGHSFTADRHRNWCQKCCEAVYYNEKDNRRHRFNNMYVIGIIVAVMTFLTYVFIELIATPILSA